MTKDPLNSAEEEGPHFVGEEEVDERSTPGKNLGAAVVIAALSILAMALSLGMPNPTVVYTAPGLLPFLTGLSLLVMAIALGVMAVRQRAGKVFFSSVSLAWHAYFRDEENVRTLVLIGVVFVYVVLVDLVAFDTEVPLGPVTFRFSSYELISIVVLTGILRFFWRGALPKCLGISFAVVVALTSAFRYGFKILLPGLG
jgi:hypothetical protein